MQDDWTLAGTGNWNPHAPKVIFQTIFMSICIMIFEKHVATSAY